MSFVRRSLVSLTGDWKYIAFLYLGGSIILGSVGLVLTGQGVPALTSILFLLLLVIPVHLLLFGMTELYKALPELRIEEYPLRPRTAEVPGVILAGSGLALRQWVTGHAVFEVLVVLGLALVVASLFQRHYLKRYAARIRKETLVEVLAALRQKGFTHYPQGASAAEILNEIRRELKEKGLV